MEGHINDLDKSWLFNFRRTINSECDPLEFAKNAITYDPYTTNTLKCSRNKTSDDDISQQHYNTQFKCNGLKILDVSSVYSIGFNSFITCSDVKINLYKIYIYLTEAITRLKSNSYNDSTNNYEDYLSALNFLLKRFNGYIKICMSLLEDVKYTPLKNTRNGGSNSSSRMQFNKFREIMSQFKVDQLELNRLFEPDSDYSNTKGSNHYLAECLTLVWSFYRESNCSDIFSLLCYTLFTANPHAFKSVLENYEPCIKTHLKENWKVLLSYIPLSFQFKDYQYVFESILFQSDSASSSNEFEIEFRDYDEKLLSSFIDWCLWRIFLIIKYTNSSYFLFIRFIKNMFKLLSNFKNTPKIDNKLQLLNFLKFIIKQYFIYKSMNSGVSYDNINKVMRNSESKDSGDQMSFFEYLDLKASKKLSLFCEFEVPQTTQECECDEQYKDKHKIYKFCLQCKTNNLSNKLKSFFVLISPATEFINTDRLTEVDLTPTEYRPGITDANREDLENEYVPLNSDFGDFYASLLSSYNSGLNDYLSGISESFMKQLTVRSFEILYSLSTVLLETGFKNKLFNLFLEIIYSGNCNYNFLENYFLIKSIFNLITSNKDLIDPKSTFDTSNTLFRLLKHFDVNRDVCNNAYSGYKRLCSNIEKSLANNKTPKKKDDKGEQSYDGVCPVFNFETLISCINCQLDFVEVLLNILSLIDADPSNVLVVTPLEIILSLVSDEHFLLLIQKILLFIIDLSLDPLEFSNCLFELINLSNYLSNVDLDRIHNMFFYTIASKNNLNYLNQQLLLWHKNTVNLAAPTDSQHGFKESEYSFLKNSLDCVLNVVRSMDLSCNINIFHLLIHYCDFVPSNSKFYNTQSYFDSMSIYSVIGLYVNYVNSNANLRSVLNGDGSNQNVKILSDKLNMLVIFSKVYKILLMFNFYNLSTRKKYQTLEYKSYDSDNLIDRSLSTLLSVLSKHKLGLELPNPDSVSATDNNKLQGKGDDALMLVFRCALDHALTTKLYTSQLFEDLKVAIAHLCPRDMTTSLFGLVTLLEDVAKNSKLDSKNQLMLESKNEALHSLCVNILFILYLGVSNLLVISNLIQFCVYTQLSESMAFLYSNLMLPTDSHPKTQNLDDESELDNALYMNIDESKIDTPNLITEEVEEELEEQDEMGRNDSLDSYYEYLGEYRTDVEINELFDYRVDYEVDGGYVYDDAHFRKSVLNMLDLNRYEKTGVRQSIGKLANKFGTNVASGFISAAIEKAEGELLNIAKKTNTFEMLKDKLFYQKKQQNLEKNLYAPILNYFEATALLHPNLYDHEGENMNELLQYRNLKQITVSRLVSLNADLACVMLMEECSYIFDTVFVRHMQQIFNENELKSVYRFLDRLVKYLEHTNWPTSVVEKITKVKEFLYLFNDFPKNVTILVSSFIFNREYRLRIFNTIPSFVAVNLQLVQDIYKSLRMFYTTRTLHKDKFKDDAALSIDNLQEYLFGPITVDDSLNVRSLSLDSGGDLSPKRLGSSTNAADFDDMDEYVEVLFSVYTEIFLDDFNIQSFLQLEPLFLLNQDKYLCFLMKLYFNLTYAANSNAASANPSTTIRSYGTHTSMFSNNSTFETKEGLILNNSRLIMVRRCIYNFLTVYPDLKETFNLLYRPDSVDLIKFLETVFCYVPDFDLSIVDNFELFKQKLIKVLTFDNFFFISESVQSIDPSFSDAIYRRLEHRLRPHSDEIVDCTRLLFEYDISNSTL